MNWCLANLLVALIWRISYELKQIFLGLDAGTVSKQLCCICVSMCIYMTDSLCLFVNV